MKKFRVVVLGGSGFAGAELIRRLLRHPTVELMRVCAADHVGEPLASAHPHLEGLCDLRFENPSPEHAVAGADVVLMALPHEASVQIVDAVASLDVRVIDMSGAFRLRRAEIYERYYGRPHPRPDLLGAFVYGLPELNREQIRGARCVASPGCFATAVELALLPLARGGFLRGPVEAVGVTGSSGSGAAPSLTAHHPTRANNLRTYRPLEHAQAPEMELALREAGGENFELSFVPVSAPLARGIFATCFVEVEETISDSTLRATFAQCYDSEPFVRVPAARLPEVVAVSGSNYAEVGFTVGTIHEGLRRVVVFSALDNLIRGGAGQAIQNLNLMLGLEESLTLDDPGPYP